MVNINNEILTQKENKILDDMLQNDKDAENFFIGFSFIFGGFFLFIICSFSWWLFTTSPICIYFPKFQKFFVYLNKNFKLLTDFYIFLSILSTIGIYFLIQTLNYKIFLLVGIILIIPSKICLYINSPTIRSISMAIFIQSSIVLFAGTPFAFIYNAFFGKNKKTYKLDETNNSIIDK